MKLLKTASPGLIGLCFFGVGLSCMTLGTCSSPTPTATASKLEVEAAQVEPELLLSAK